MKSIVLLLGLTFAANAHAATAYEALRIVGKEQGESVLDQVIEVRGKGGAPNPRTWRIVSRAKEARGGEREFDVQGTKLVGNRAPSEGTPGKILNVNNLNLDSDGAHTIAEREAKKTGYAYDHVDYVLRAIGDGTTPVWEVRLVDERAGKTATLNLGADSGKMITARGLKRSAEAIAEGEEKPRRNSDPDGGDTDSEDESTPPASVADSRRRRARDAEESREREEQRRREERNREVDKPGTKIGRFFERATRHIGNAFQRAGNSVDRAVNGGNSRTAPPPPPTRTEPRRVYRDVNGTEYYRPRD